ncbi:MAG: ester cyclase [Planctomycetota bacterium]
MSNADISRAAIEAFNERAYDRVPEYFAADVEYIDVGTGMVLNGAAAIPDVWKGWASAFSNVKGEITNLIDGGDHTVLEITWTGTHDGPLQTPNGDIPATNKDIKTNGCIVSRFADGKVVMSKHYSDMMGMMSQLGLIPNG